MTLERFAGTLLLQPVSGGVAPVAHDWFELAINPDGSRTLHTLTRFPGNAIAARWRCASRLVEHSRDVVFQIASLERLELGDEPEFHYV